MWHRISDFSLNSMRRILNNVQPTLHSMAIDLTSGMTHMPLTGLVEVGYGVNRRDSPCLCLLVNHTRMETAATAAIFKLPHAFFGEDSPLIQLMLLPVCLFSEYNARSAHTEAEQMESYF